MKAKRYALIFLGVLAITSLLLPDFSFGNTVTYAYDNLNRLTKVVYENGAIEEFAYDPAGNRINYSSSVPTTGNISGRVTDSQGNGIASVGIWIFDQSGKFVTDRYTDSSGNYEIKEVTPGNYTVEFNTSFNHLNYVAGYYNNKKKYNEADLVNVAAGQTTANINAQLELGGSISGKISDGVGKGVGTIAIGVYSLNNVFVTFDVTSFSWGGNYKIFGIPAGTYKVRFSISNNTYKAQWYNNKDDFPEADPVSVTAGQTTGGINATLLADNTSPSLSVTSHTDGQQVTTSSIILAGTASDAGKGDNGILQVTVNGSRASNDTATGSGTANWSKQVSLNCGANGLNVAATDNSTNHNSAAQSITINYNYLG